ncbi:hypothetical protein ACO2Q9_13955 [Variovorax sp. VNK109]|uniref:hypothetical protein n=1 Tax=Variovorax sp. VNK109 TaxID=3400919 RepID=UPI003C0CFA0E
MNVENFVDDVPGVLPVRNQGRIAAMLRMASEIFGSQQNAQRWISNCSESDLSVLHECVEAAAQWGR